METSAQGVKGRLIRCPDGKIRLKVNGIDHDILLQNLDIEIQGDAALFEENGKHYIDYRSSLAQSNLLRYKDFIGQVHRGLKHLAIFSPSEILPFRTEKLTKKQYMSADGRPFMVNMDSQRYAVFAQSLSCVDCGLVGEAMILDGSKDGTSAHFNLYGLNANKELIMLTKDHLKPKALGGKDVLSNYITMCDKCNCKKGHKYIGVLSDHLRDWDFNL
jgi:HNH endonuclease